MSLLLFYSRLQKVAQLTDTLPFNDTLNRLQDVHRSTSDTSTLTDTSHIYRVYERYATDTFTLSGSGLIDLETESGNNLETESGILLVAEQSQLSYFDNVTIQQTHYRTFSHLDLVTNDVVSFNQIHYRLASDYYPIIDETFDTSTHFRAPTDTSVLSANLGTQIITGLGVTEFIFTLDSLSYVFGKPVPYITLPDIGINTPYTVPSPVMVPRIPLGGYPIAFNAQLGSLSLAPNSISNSQFPEALYVFYNKNNSVWYKYKSLPLSDSYFNQTWSNENLLYSGTGFINNESGYLGGAGVVNSTTIFDLDGYPITAFENEAGFIGVQYFVNGEAFVVNTSNQGTYPNVIISNGTIIVMWIPPNYSNYLYFSDSNAAFQKACPYYVNVPGYLKSFSLTQSADTSWVFSFTTKINGQDAVYFAST
jgi:hypothetical protein